MYPPAPLKSKPAWTVTTLYYMKAKFPDELKRFDPKEGEEEVVEGTQEETVEEGAEAE